MNYAEAIGGKKRKQMATNTSFLETKKPIELKKKLPIL